MIQSGIANTNVMRTLWVRVFERTVRNGQLNRNVDQIGASHSSSGEPRVWQDEGRH
jgi:hypothetical protein